MLKKCRSAKQILRAEKDQAVKLAIADTKNALQKELTHAQARVAELEQAMASQKQNFEVERAAFNTEKQLAVTQAKSELEKERDALASQLKISEAEKSQQENEFKVQLSEKLRAKDELIAYKEQEIERYRDMKARLSTKMLGESLEQRCKIEFNRLRATAFPHAYFEKDNDASLGSEGGAVRRIR